MKKTILTTIYASLLISLMAQVPQGISHQAVIRNANNQLVTDSPVGIRVGIRQGAPGGTEVYSETHTPQSNANGLITFVIGQGADQSSDFSAIDWADGLYFVKTEADPEGGTNYTIEGVSQLWSVPYALSANASFSVGDSLVLKDENGMTRFVLNPNTGMLKMMHNDTVWYSIAVSQTFDKNLRNREGSVSVLTTYTDGEGMYIEGNPQGLYYAVYSDESKENIIEEYHKYLTPTIYGVGFVLSEFKQWYPNGNLKFKKIRRVKDVLPKLTYEDEMIEYNEDGTIRSKVIRETDAMGKLFKEEVFAEENKKSEITHESGYFPDMGFEYKKAITETFQGDEELVNKKIELTSLKNTTEEKYESKVTTNQFYKDGVISRQVIESLLDQWDETVKTYERIARMFNPAGIQVSEIKVKNTSDANYDPVGGSMSRSNTTEMFADGVKIADQNRSMNHYPDPSNYTEDSESSATYLPDGSLISKTESEKTTWPGGTGEKTTKTYVDNNGITIQIIEQSQNGLPQNSSLRIGGINREYTQFTNNDNLNKAVTSFRNEDNTTTAKVTEEFNKNEALHKRTVEKPGQGSTHIKQNNTEIEFKADQVVSDGDHVVTGTLNTLGDSYVSGNQDVYGNSNVEGDQEVGGNLSTLLDMIAKGKKKFRIDHPQFPDTKFLQHASIESNEVLNLYSGNVETDIDGNATVTLPDYFDLINTDFRYQLTVIGTTFARAIIFSEIDENNQFIIKTDEPNTKVSWQVTAKRNDQYLIDNPFSDVVDK
jgi:hypothetical protein